MIRELISDVARQLVTENSGWLSQIRTLGYLQNIDSKIIISDNENEIGITDVRGNSGYIRYRTDQNFTVDELTASERYTSCGSGSRYSYFLRLVVVAKTSTPENVSLLLSTQLNSFTYTGDKVKTRVTGGGSHSVNISKTEGIDQLNNTYRVMYLDFTLSFDWRKDCDQIPFEMDCDNCLNIYDMGCMQHCGEIELEQVSEFTGIATLNTFFNGNTIVQSFPVTEGEPVVIPMDGLNENYEYNIQLKDAAGEVITLVFGSPEENYDCFKIKLTP
jgi:hypothetical protein